MLGTHSTTPPSANSTLHPPATLDAESYGRAQLQRWRRFEFAMWMNFALEDAPWSWCDEDVDALLDFVEKHGEEAMVREGLSFLGFEIGPDWFAGPGEVTEVLLEVKMERAELAQGVEPPTS